MMASNPEIDPTRILTCARQIAFPRYPGSRGDARAIKILSEAFREIGLPVEIEEFTYDVRPAFRALRIFLVAVALTL